MIFECLTVEHFKGLPDRAFEFCEGMNLVVGANRAGKTSLHQALLTALFGLGNKDDPPARWEDALPWGFAGEGSLALQYKTSSGRYLLERSVGRSRVTLKEEQNGEWRVVAASPGEAQQEIANHVRAASRALFARTVSIAQGQLARLGQGDRQDIGRALEEVMVGRTGATFERALEYLNGIVRDPKTGLRKARNDRTPRKLDRYEEEAEQLGAQISEAKRREETLEQARHVVNDLDETLPAKRDRLRVLAGDPQKDGQLGLLTKLAQKRGLEEDKKRLGSEAKDLGDLLDGLEKVDREIAGLRSQITATESLRNQQPERLEEKLASLEKGLATACGVAAAHEERVRARLQELEGLRQAKPKSVVLAWELAIGALLTLGPLGVSWLTGRWAASAAVVVGVALFVDAVRRSFRAKTASAVEESTASQIQDEEGKKKQAEEGRDKANEALDDLCRQFGVTSADDLRGQIALVRRLRGAESRKETLIGNRTMQQIDDELSKKSVDQRGISEQLKSSMFADFNPTTEEVEAWRKEAEELGKELPALEASLNEARGKIGVLEGQVAGQTSSGELEARLEWLRDEIQRGDRTVEACEEADRLLREVQEEHRTTYLPPLEQTTSAHLKRMTGGFYSAVSLAKGWPDITVGDPRNPEVEPDQLSGGSRDQLYFAFRLAVADQLSGGEPLPLLLDEPFVNLDHEHQERALDILADLGSSGRQVIYFTMLPEMAESLERRAEGKFGTQRLSLGGF